MAPPPSSLRALAASLALASALALHKSKLPPSAVAPPAPPAPQDCSNLPGLWTGGFGKACGEQGLGDSYSFNWTLPRAPGAWTATMISGGGWGTGLAQNSADNSTTVISLDAGNTLRGNISATTQAGQCSCILWDNGSWWMKAPPPPPPITDVHIIAMNHLDVGYNGIPGLGLINNIVNRYFHVYFPRAISVAQDLTARGEAPRLIYTTHPWLLHLYMHCPVDFVLSNISLQCPSAADVQAMQQAIQRGDITWHAAAFNTEYENALNPEMIDVQFQLARDLADENGVPRPKTVSLRDVPGTTRSLVPHLVRNNITGISIGVNGGSPAPLMPNPGVWLDPASGASVLYMQTGQGQGYPNNPGGDPVNCGGMCRTSCVEFAGLSHALCWAFRTDNSGPPMNAQEVYDQFAIAQWQFPGARIFASTYDNFTAQLNTVRAALPVSTGEVGDTWMTSTTADPYKIAFYREAARAYAICVQTAQCDIHDPRVIGFTRMLAKIPEHTYGFPGLDDSINFTNEQFHAAIAAGEQAYVDCKNSYTEQRDIAAREGFRYLADHPLAANISARVAALVPLVPDTSALTQVDQGDWGTAIQVTTPGGDLTLGLDGTSGAFSVFNVGGVDWADSEHLLAQYVYKTYNDTDYDANPTCCYGEGSRQKIANPNRTATTPQMTGLWVDDENNVRLAVVSMTMPDLQHDAYGAPGTLWLTISVNDDASVSLDLQLFGVTATRLGGAHFYHFQQIPQAGDWSWMMDKIGGWVSPLDTVPNGGIHQHGVSDGGIRYASAAAPSTKFLTVRTIDAALVDPFTAVDPPSMFPLPLSPLTGPVLGFDVQLMQNGACLERSARARACARAERTKRLCAGLASYPFPRHRVFHRSLQHQYAPLHVGPGLPLPLPHQRRDVEGGQSLRVACGRLSRRM